MFRGFFQLGGAEIINSERTFRYVQNNMPQFPLKDCDDCGTGLHQALGDRAYESPLVDDAPWMDEHNPDTRNFFGFYPLELTGSLDDTTAASVTEGILDGGHIGSPRAGTREMRYRGLMIARDQLSLHAGMTWLKAALHPAPCEAHGGSCSGTTACMYAACPDVTLCYREDGVEQEPIPMGQTTAATPFVHLFTGPGRVAAVMDIPITDGFGFEWMARPVGTEPGSPDHRGPVVSRRTNFLINPSFTDPSLTTGWTGSGAGTLTRVDGGGVDGGAYAAYTPTVATTARYNWMSEPSFETSFDPASAGWASNGAAGLVVVDAGTAAQGLRYAEAGWDPVEPDLWLAGTINEPFGTTSRVVSLWVGQTTHAVVLDLLDDAGLVVATQTVLATGLTAPWTRVQVASTSSTHIAQIRVTQLTPATTPEPLRVDGFKAEPGATPTGYFDGGTPATSTVAYRWVNDDPEQGAIETTAAAGTFTLRSANTPTTFGPVIGSFALRAPGTDAGVTVVQAEVRSVADDTLMATAQFNPTAEWVRYAVPVLQSRNVYVKLNVTQGAVHFDQMMLEAGTKRWPYFDGTTASFDPYSPATPTRYTDDYEIIWTGTPEHSTSQMTWATGVNPADPTRQLLILNDVCVEDWELSLLPDAGAMSGGLVRWSVREPIPFDEQAVKYERNFHDVAATAGPTVIREFTFEVGAALEVEFTVTAGTPFAYGTTDDLLTRVPITDLTIMDWNDPACELPDLAPILDPDCPPLPAPPRPPTIPNLCVDDITTWKRISLVIPAERVSGWSQMLPTVLLTTKAEDVRQVRVRFTPNPFKWPITTATNRLNLADNPAASSTNALLNKLGYRVLSSSSTLTRQYSGTPPNSPPVPGGSVPPNPTLPKGVRTFISVHQTASLLSAGSFGVESGAVGYNLVTPGKYVTVSQYVQMINVSTMKMRVIFQNSGGTAIGSPIYSPIYTPTPGSFRRITMGGIHVPATAVRVRAEWVSNVQTTNNAVVNVTGLLIEEFDTPHLEADDYFDGSSTGEGIKYTWTGTVGNSTSTAVYSPLDPCGYCSEFILSYLPANSELTVDGLTHSAYASVSGGAAKPASHLLYGTDGTPMSWPSLSCGIQYVMTVDVPESVPDLAISLALTQQE